jgi:hypothetical protein
MTFHSDLSGIFKVSNVEDRITFTSSFLDPGVHHITVTADDGRVKRESWVQLEVLATHTVPDDGTVDSVNVPLIVCTTLSIIGIVMLLTLALLYQKGQREIAARTSSSLTPTYRSSSSGYRSSVDKTVPKYDSHRAPKSTSRPTQGPVPRSTPKLAPNPDLGDFDLSFDEPETAPEPRARPQPEVASRRERSLVEDGSWRVKSVDEFIKLIQMLPAGLPEPLWGVDWPELARAVVTTSTEDEEGRPVALYRGRKYHADKRNLRMFMQEAD